MKPLPKKMQDEYDALGLPFTNYDEASIIDARSRLVVGHRLDDVCKAANNHHRLLAENERLRELLKVAKCPVCDGSGFFYSKTGVIGTGIEEVRADTCSWCFERHESLKETESE